MSEPKYSLTSDVLLGILVFLCGGILFALLFIIPLHIKFYSDLRLPLPVLSHISVSASFMAMRSWPAIVFLFVTLLAIIRFLLKPFWRNLCLSLLIVASLLFSLVLWGGHRLVMVSASIYCGDKTILEYEGCRSLENGKGLQEKYFAVLKAIKERNFENSSEGGGALFIHAIGETENKSGLGLLKEEWKRFAPGNEFSLRAEGINHNPLPFCALFTALSRMGEKPDPKVLQEYAEQKEAISFFVPSLLALQQERSALGALAASKKFDYLRVLTNWSGPEESPEKFQAWLEGSSDAQVFRPLDSWERWQFLNRLEKDVTACLERR